GYKPSCARSQPPATIPPGMNTHDTQCSNVLPKIPRRAAAQLEHSFYAMSLLDHLPYLATRAFVGKLLGDSESTASFTAVT
ncbi:MAG: hypothetical protein O2856_11170, partial [Planctomycetota bacterium]|nr:hypothetical protein [Planctomycetota bacterium]